MWFHSSGQMKPKIWSNIQIKHRFCSTLFFDWWWTIGWALFDFSIPKHFLFANINSKSHKCQSFSSGSDCLIFIVQTIHSLSPDRVIYCKSKRYSAYHPPPTHLALCDKRSIWKISHFNLSLQLVNLLKLRKCAKKMCVCLSALQMEFTNRMVW